MIPPSLVLLRMAVMARLLLLVTTVPPRLHEDRLEVWAPMNTFAELVVGPTQATQGVLKTPTARCCLEVEEAEEAPKS